MAGRDVLRGAQGSVADRGFRWQMHAVEQRRDQHDHRKERREM